MISSAQIRAARAMLDVTIDRLSKESGVSALLILQIEAANGYDATPQHYAALQDALERMGVSFLKPGDGGTGGEGLRLAAQTGEAGLRPEELHSANDD